MPTSTVEDYLKCILLEQEQQRDPEALVSMRQVSSALGVAPGTVTAMVKTLADSGLVSYEPYSGVRLTDSGRQLALHVLRRHRLIERFLVDVMRMDWSEVHSEAEELEHAVSDRLIQRMDEMLGYPSVDPRSPDRRPRRAAYALPTLFTAGNIFLGYLSILRSFRGAMLAATGAGGAPEHFAIARVRDTGRFKQFRKAISQLDEEGVVQVLRDRDLGDQAPMLAAVGHPVAINPDKALRQEAETRDWPVRVFARPVRPARTLPTPPGDTRAWVAAALVGVVLLTVWSTFRRTRPVTLRE